jgi:hypothetical protein
MRVSQRDQPASSGLWLLPLPSPLLSSNIRHRCLTSHAEPPIPIAKRRRGSPGVPSCGALCQRVAGTRNRASHRKPTILPKRARHEVRRPQSCGRGRIPHRRFLLRGCRWCRRRTRSWTSGAASCAPEANQRDIDSDVRAEGEMEQGPAAPERLRSRPTSNRSIVSPRSFPPTEITPGSRTGPAALHSPALHPPPGHPLSVRPPAQHTLPAPRPTHSAACSVRSSTPSPTRVSNHRRQGKR